jgi:hypothetical protein
VCLPTASLLPIYPSGSAPHELLGVLEVVRIVSHWRRSQEYQADFGQGGLVVLGASNLLRLRDRARDQLQLVDERAEI